MGIYLSIPLATFERQLWKYMFLIKNLQFYVEWEEMRTYSGESDKMEFAPKPTSGYCKSKFWRMTCNEAR